MNQRSMTFNWRGSALPIFLTALMSILFVVDSLAAELEEIVVTAQKRVSGLQDTAMSITAIDGNQLAKQNITEWRDIQVPGLFVGEGGDARSQFIRGVGTVPLERGFEMAVPIYYDGIYSGRGRHNALGLWDVGSIEVLKGPQPTHVGKNAIGGAILVNSAKPTDEFMGELGVGYETEASEFKVDGVLSGPISETLKARLAVSHRTMDGWGVNIADNNVKVPEHDDIRIRGSIVYEPSDRVDVFAKIEYADLEQIGGVRTRFNCGPGAPVDPSVGGGSCVKDEVVTLGFDPDTAPIGFFSSPRHQQVPLRIAMEHMASSVLINWHFDNFTLTSNTGYFEYDNYVFQKPDFNTAAIPILIVDTPEFFDQFSQELRLTSTTDGKVDWLVGAYFDTSDTEIRAEIAIPPAGVAFTDVLNVDQQSWALFAELVYHVSDQVSVRLGSRYSDVDKDGIHVNEFFFITPQNTLIDSLTAIGIDLSYLLDETRSDSDFQPAVTFEWRPSDEALYYLSWKEGFKAGGFGISGVPPSGAFDPETVTAWEAGAKYSLFNDAATLNLSLFHSKFENLQVSTFNPVTALFETRNAEESRSQGLEAEFAWAATDELTVRASGLFLDAEYIDFSGVNCFLNPAQTAAEGCDFSTVPPSTNLGGQPLALSPEFSGMLSLDYERPFGNNLLFSSVFDLYYSDEFHITSRGDRDVYQDAYSKINLRVAVGSVDGNWELALVGRNLTDEITAHMIEDTPAEGLSNWANIDRLRQFMIQASFRW